MRVVQIVLLMLTCFGAGMFVALAFCIWDVRSDGKILMYGQTWTCAP